MRISPARRPFCNASHWLLFIVSLSLVACASVNRSPGEIPPSAKESVRSSPELPGIGLRKSLTLRGSASSTPATPDSTATTPPPRHTGRNIYFAFGSSELPATARQTVQTVATLYKTEARRQITLIGHTADLGSKEFSIALGQRRVEVVAEELEKFGVPARAIKRISYGSESERASACKTEDCLQDVRRVEIVLGDV